MKKKIFVATTCCTLTALLNFTAQAEIYKWTDNKGVTHYSARPPAQRKKAAKNIKDIEKKIRQAAGKYRPLANTNTTLNNNSEKSSGTEQQKTTNTEIAPPSKKLVSYCKKQRSSLKKLKSNFRTVWKGLDGKEKRLNQSERKEKIDYLIKRITEDCEGV